MVSLANPYLPLILITSVTVWNTILLNMALLNVLISFMVTVSDIVWNLCNILGSVSHIAMLCVSILTSDLTLKLVSVIPIEADSI